MKRENIFFPRSFQLSQTTSSNSDQSRPEPGCVGELSLRRSRAGGGGSHQHVVPVPGLLPLRLWPLCRLDVRRHTRLPWPGHGTAGGAARAAAPRAFHLSPPEPHHRRRCPCHSAAAGPRLCHTRQHLKCDGLRRRTGAACADRQAPRAATCVRARVPHDAFPGGARGRGHQDKPLFPGCRLAGVHRGCWGLGCAERGKSAWARRGQERAGTGAPLQLALGGPPSQVRGVCGPRIRVLLSPGQCSWRPEGLSQTILDTEA